MLADLLARLAYPLFGRALPVGVVTALLGGPLFLTLLFHSAALLQPALSAARPG